MIRKIQDLKWYEFRTAIAISSLGVAFTYTTSVLFHFGWRWPMLLSDTGFGFFLCLTMWVFHLYFFYPIDRWLLKKNNFQSPTARQVVRFICSLCFAAALGYTFEEISWAHIGWEMDQQAPVTYVNETRALMGAMLVYWGYIQTKALRKAFRNQLEVERLRHDNTAAQFELLKRQINPHFLFNSLHILKTLVKTSDARSEEYLLRMADFYRYLLLNEQREKIPLEEELTVLENYLYMLRARFGDSLTVKICPISCKGSVPPFALQILVENCIKHNVVSRDKPLFIEICCDANHIKVTNNLQVKRHSEPGGHWGLENLNRRYQVLLGQDIQIMHDETTFTVRLPLIKS